jgi:hypothetical protein
VDIGTSICAFPHLFHAVIFDFYELTELDKLLHFMPELSASGNDYGFLRIFVIYFKYRAEFTFSCANPHSLGHKIPLPQSLKIDELTLSAYLSS